MKPHQRSQRVVPGPGQESVWDYPRPPRLEASTRRVTVSFGGRLIADTRAAYRVLETSHPPTWYLPPADLDRQAIRRSDARGTICEWKGLATYWDVLGPNGEVRAAAGWSYEQPTPDFRAITGYLSFMPAQVECRIDDELVRAQEGGFYGGWITDDVVGPFKGAPGTLGW